MKIWADNQERLIFYVSSSRRGQRAWRVDMETKECECQIFYGRKTGGCRHIAAIQELVRLKRAGQKRETKKL